MADKQFNGIRMYSYYDPPPATAAVEKYEPSLTRQSEAASCDINNIVKKYHNTGVLPPARDAGIYADVSQMGDYRTALDQVKMANELFMKLPSGTRAEFQNDPAAFLDFVSDPENGEALVEMGLVQAPTAPEAAPTPAPGADAEPKPSPDG